MARYRVTFRSDKPDPMGDPYDTLRFKVDADDRESAIDHAYDRLADMWEEVSTERYRVAEVARVTEEA